MQDIKTVLLKSRQCLVVVDYDLYENETSYLDDIGAFLKHGADVIQLKFKNKDDADSLSITKKIRDLTSYFNSLLIVESRADIVKITGADGIFLNDNDISLNDAKIVLGEDIIYGVQFDIEKTIEADFYFLNDLNDANDNLKKYFVEYKKGSCHSPFYINSRPFDNTLKIIKGLADNHSF